MALYVLGHLCAYVENTWKPQRGLSSDVKIIYFADPLASDELAIAEQQISDASDDEDRILGPLLIACSKAQADHNIEENSHNPYKYPIEATEVRNKSNSKSKGIYKVTLAELYQKLSATKPAEMKNVFNDDKGETHQQNLVGIRRPIDLA